MTTTTFADGSFLHGTDLNAAFALVAAADSPTFTTKTIVGGGSTNALTITPGASSTSAVTLAQSGTGGISFSGTPTISANTGTFSAQFYTTPTATYAQSGVLVPIVFASGHFTGSQGPSSSSAPFQFTMGSDTMDVTPNGPKGSPAMQINRNIGGTGTKGGRSGLRMSMNINTAIVGDTSSQQYSGIESWFQANANAGGTGTGALAAGAIYGLAPQVTIGPGATYYGLANALGEADISVNGSTQPLTLGGTVTGADTLTVTFTSTSIVGSPVSVVFTLDASHTLNIAAQNLVALINNNSALNNAGIAAHAAAAVVNLFWPTQNTVTPSVAVGGAATETMTLGTFVAGGCVDKKLGGSIVRITGDTTRAMSDDAALIFGAQGDAPVSGQWTQGLMFGSYDYGGGSWAFAPNSTLIGAGYQTANGSSGRTSWLTQNYSKYGLDFRNINFSSASGLALATPGFDVDGSGNLGVSNFEISPISGGIALDIPEQRGSVAIASGGGGTSGGLNNRYYVDDLIYDAVGGQYIVSSVSVNGAVTGLTTVIAPYVGGSPPSNPVSTTGGSGIGLTLTITWSANNKLALNPSGGPIAFFGSSGATKPTVSGSKGGNAALGSLITALASLGLITDTTT